MGRIFGVILLLGMMTAGVARGDEASDAKRAYQQGLKHYNLSQWQLALTEFQKAYLAKPAPALLFNIGQCQRQLADQQGAINSFKAFLREAPEISAAQRAQAESFIVQLEQALAARPKAPMEAAPAPTPPSETTSGAQADL